MRWLISCDRPTLIVLGQPDVQGELHVVAVAVQVQVVDVLHLRVLLLHRLQDGARQLRRRGLRRAASRS